MSGPKYIVPLLPVSRGARHGSFRTRRRNRAGVWTKRTGFDSTLRRPDAIRLKPTANASSKLGTVCDPHAKCGLLARHCAKICPKRLSDTPKRHWQCPVESNWTLDLVEAPNDR
ncbi:hypothetical protein [Novosphingobium sp. MMS21-SN21R]|uniref:hypothetical protein n=1 Tax=Novosphingobium sp. MMS21-SN21R TaxID=2969298 RepID=UPI002886321B|nr:hypothetical protein [Novosphingobium sp. MMS21-SN21R]MDT0506923.1 hypothetical protein [Novosphingobium sp. MMS21-SN21R]